MFLKNQSTILPTNIQKIFHVSKPPRRLLRASFSGFLTFLRLSLVFLPFLPFSGYLRLSPACLHPSILPSFHPCILPSLPPDVTRQKNRKCCRGCGIVLSQIVLGLMCPGRPSGGGESQNGAKSRRFWDGHALQGLLRGVNPKTILNNCHQQCCNRHRLLSGNFISIKNLVFIK